MTTVGIRELRQRASELLRLVAQGETIQITDRGHPVAVLAPLPDDAGPLERLRRAGAVRPATRLITDLPEPIGLAGELPSAVLERIRAEERY